MNSEIFQQTLKVVKGEDISKIAIIVNTNINELHEDIHQYVGETPICMFTDIKCDNPWVRVIITGINHLTLVNFDKYLKNGRDYESLARIKERKEKLQLIEKNKNE
jgi:hypothetical protein